MKIVSAQRATGARHASGAASVVRLRPAALAGNDRKHCIGARRDT
jgi:hypothetical protein